MNRRILFFFACTSLVLTASAAAQTPAPAASRAPGRPKELVLGGLVAGPSSLGSADAQLRDGSGAPSVTLFSVDNRFATGFGLEAAIGVQLRRALWLEVVGGWTRAGVRSEIGDDFENAEDAHVSMIMSRFLIEGAAVWYFRDRGRTSWFVRAGGGWMRETAGGNTLTGDGWTGGAGLGLRHWWRTTGKGAVKRVGFRAEGRAAIRTGGLSLGERDIRFGPSGAAHFVFGF